MDASVSAPAVGVCGDAVDEGGGMGSRDGSVGAEGARGAACGDVVGVHPCDRGAVVAVGVDVVEDLVGVVSRAGVAVQERGDVGSGGGGAGAEHRRGVGGGLLASDGHACFDGPADGGVRVGARVDVVEDL